MIDDKDIDEKLHALHSMMDGIFSLVRSSDRLKEEFKFHALGQLARDLESDDRIAVEIATEVNVRWSDRKQSPIRSEPWIATPSTFVKHVYQKWLDRKQLALHHLAQDSQLYEAYRAHVRRHPEDDLLLLKQPRRRIVDAGQHLRERRAKDRLRKAGRRKVLS